jgi:hypothetical protein
LEVDINSYWPSLAINIKCFSSELTLILTELIANRTATDDPDYKLVLKNCANASIGLCYTKAHKLYTVQHISLMLLSQLVVILLACELIDDGIELFAIRTDGFFIKVQKNKLDELNAKMINFMGKYGLSARTKKINDLFIFKNKILCAFDDENIKCDGWKKN